MEEDVKKIESLKNGEHVYFNMFQGGGAVCYRCNDMFLLFSIPLYGGVESYEGTYFDHQIKEILSEAYSWT